MEKNELLEVLKDDVDNADCELGFDLIQDDDGNFVDVEDILSEEEYNKIKKCYDRAKEALDDLRNVIDDLLEEQE